jgi:hypothetical protein
MPGPEHDVHFDQYEECYALYEQEKYTECTKLCSENMKDQMLPCQSSSTSRPASYLHVPRTRIG